VRAVKSTLVVAVTALVSCILLASHPARAEDGPPVGAATPPTAGNSGPSSLQRWIDSAVPAPPLAVASQPTSERQSTLWHAVLSPPVGDPFFDSWPSNVDKLSPGQLIEQRDVTAKTASLSTTPIGRAVLMKFGSTSASGTPSFGTATLIIPAAIWTGPGPRPVQVNTLPINSLGLHCTPGYTIGRGERDNVIDVFLPTIWSALSRGYAVLVPDHEGPLMSYAEPIVAGHVVLDSIRAVRSMSSNEFRDSRFGVSGYSGGAIASYAAAMLLNDYAPELASVVVGAAMGGLVTDYSALAHHFNGNFASGILLSVVLAMTREHPDMLPYMNHLAQWVATSPLKDVCGDADGPLGEIGIPIDVAANIDHPLDSPIADKIYREMNLTGRKSAVPLYIYHGTTDVWIPGEESRQLYQRQCDLGVPAVFRTVPGDHIGAMLAGLDGADTWLEARLRGRNAQSECPIPR